jgi:hypothetical protein
MLHALDLTRSFQTAKTPWQAVSKNDNETLGQKRTSFTLIGPGIIPPGRCAYWHAGVCRRWY